MRARAKLSLSKFLIYISVFIFISIFTNLVLSVNIYKKEIADKNESYAANVLLNNLAITDSSIHLAEEYFDNIYNQFILNTNMSLMRTDLPNFMTENLFDIYKYDIKDAANIKYKDIHEIIELNKEYNINMKDGKVIFFYKSDDIKYPLIVMYQDFNNDSKRLVASFKMPYQSKFFEPLNRAVESHDAYYFFIEHNEHIVAFAQNESEINFDFDTKKLNSIESQTYDYKCAYYIDENKYNNSFFLIMTMFAILNILFFVVFITIYNYYKLTKIESRTDIMTGLYNRRYLFAKVSSSLKRKQYPIGFIVIDVDYLKFINDTYGHLKGDEAINQIASILKSVFRENDVVARIGGDEFAILLANARKEVISILIERIVQCINDQNAKNPDNLPISVSTGFYVAEDDKTIDDAEALFKMADDEMYNSKITSHKKYETKLIKWCKKHNVTPPKPRS